MHRISVDVRTGIQTHVECTDEEVASQRAAIEAALPTQYQRDRAAAYPSIVDQLDALYHGGYDGWHQQIQAVKDRYPKGTR